MYEMESTPKENWTERMKELKERTERCRQVAIRLREILEPLQKEIETYKNIVYMTSIRPYSI